jgi:hypothetical protein
MTGAPPPAVRGSDGGDPTPPPPAPDWIAVPPPAPVYGAPAGWAVADSGWGPPAAGWTPGAWTPAPFPSEPFRAPARPADGDRRRLALVALAGAVAGAAIAAVVGSALFLAGAREMGEAMGDRVAESLDQRLGWSSDPFPTAEPAGPIEQSEPVPPGVLGPDPVLNAYAQQCFDGDLQSCDDLFFNSTPMSDYEEYGMSCGRRVEAGAVIACTELD